MSKIISVKILSLFVFLFSIAAFAQPLPKIELKPIFPNLQVERPVWMSEAPDGSDDFSSSHNREKFSSSKKVRTTRTRRNF